jgi:cytochrome P450
MKTSSADLDIDLRTAPRVRGNALLGDLDAIREREPVFWSEQSHCWLLTRHQDVADLFMGRMPVRHSGRIEAFSFAHLSREDLHRRIPTVAKYVPQWIINLDGENHSRIRLLLVKAFSKRIVENLREYARSQSERLIDEAVERGAVEFNEEIARVLTGHVLFKLLGMPEEMFASLKDWAIAIVEGFGTGRPSIDLLERADRAAAQMNSAVLDELEKRRKAPRDDLLTGLLEVAEAGERLTVDELLAQMQIIIVAGHDTTANSMTLGVEALSRHPDAWRYMRDHPDTIGACIAELQRYIAMSGGQALLAAEDFTLEGKHIKAGDVLVGLIAAADRDPLMFQDADRIDMTRDNRQSLVFAPGPHFCLGHMLAKMQLAEFFSALVRHVESVELLDAKLDFMPVFSFRGLYSLPVRFHPRASA